MNAQVQIRRVRSCMKESTELKDIKFTDPAFDSRSVVLQLTYLEL